MYFSASVFVYKQVTNLAFDKKQRMENLHFSIKRNESVRRRTGSCVTLWLLVFCSFLSLGMID